MGATVLYTYMYLEGCKKITLLPHTEKKREKKCYPSAKGKILPTHTSEKRVHQMSFFFSLRPVVKCHFANDGEEERNKHISSMLCTVVSPNIKF